MKVLLSILLCLFPSCLSGQHVHVAAGQINPALLNSHWQAEWITHPVASVLDYGVFHFRHNFWLDSLPKEFIIHVSADNRYLLFLNGKPVCRGPQRGSPENWFFESLDISPVLTRGINTLAAVVWNFGEMRPWAQFSFRTALIVQGNGPLESIVNTSGLWKVVANGAYSPAPAGARETYGQFVVVGPCEKVDACRYPWGWELPGYDDSAWPKARALDVGHPYGVGTDINWVLTPRRIPPLEEKPLAPPVVRRSVGITIPTGFPQSGQSLSIPPQTTCQVLLDQQHLTTGYPEFHFGGGRGAEITITYAESLFDFKGEKGNRNEIENKRIVGYSDIFLPDGQDLAIFKPLWLRTWRYIQLDISTSGEPLTLESLAGESSGYPFVAQATFDSDDPALEAIWETGWRTARLCAHETYFDCPYYEQLQYVGDTRIQALISLYVSGDDRLVRNALLQFDASRRQEGITQSRYPSASPQYIPPYSLFWISMVYDYWMLREDRTLIEGFLPGIEQVLNWFTNRLDTATGLMGPLPYWSFVDWAREWPWQNEKRIGGVPAGGQTGNSSILTLHLAYTLQHAAHVFRAFGYGEKASRYERLSGKLASAVFSLCYDEARGYVADTPEKSSFSMHAQILAVLTNTIEPVGQPAFTARFIEDSTLIQPTMYFRFYLARALKKSGMASQYLETLGLWRQMLENGLTTFAENPDPTRSDCHAWSASPNYDFLATVAGIEPLTPGFSSVLVQPAPGKLTRISGSMPHPAGTIRFSLKRTAEEGLMGFVELPPGVQGVFVWAGKSIPLQGMTAINR